MFDPTANQQTRIHARNEKHALRRMRSWICVVVSASTRHRKLAVHRDAFELM